MEIIALQIPEFIQPDCLERLLAKVSESKKEKLLKYRRPQDTYRSLLGELLVRIAACQSIGCANGTLQFDFNRYGKPFLADYPGFSFNLSHSGGWAAVVWDPRPQALGVDVEEMRPMQMDIAERFFAASEYRDLMSRQGKDQLEYFFRLWTLKESYVKARGKGLSLPLNEFSLTRRDHQEWYSPEAGAFRFKTYDLDERHMLAACAEMEDIPERFKEITFSDMCEMAVEM